MGSHGLLEARQQPDPARLGVVVGVVLRHFNEHLTCISLGEIGGFVDAHGSLHILDGQTLVCQLS